MQQEAFIIETVYGTSVENVWSAITNSKEMKQWYFDIPGFKPEPGFEFQFKSVPDEERQYRHNCQVIESKLFKKLSFTWQYSQYEEVTLVTFELFARPDGKTHFRLMHEGLESYPDSDPDFSRESFSDGWTWLIETALNTYLENAYKPVQQELAKVVGHFAEVGEQ